MPWCPTRYSLGGKLSWGMRSCAPCDDPRGKSRDNPLHGASHEASHAGPHGTSHGVDHGIVCRTGCIVWYVIGVSHGVPGRQSVGELLCHRVCGRLHYGMTHDAIHEINNSIGKPFPCGIPWCWCAPQGVPWGEPWDLPWVGVSCGMPWCSTR